MGKRENSMKRMLFSKFFTCVFAVISLILTVDAYSAPPPSSGCLVFKDYLDISEDGMYKCDEFGGDLGFDAVFGSDPYFTISGTGICSTTGNPNYFVGDTGTPSSTSGQYCWCQLTGFEDYSGATATGASTYSVLVRDDYNDSGECLVDCGCYCAKALSQDEGLRGEFYNLSFCIGSGGGGGCGTTLLDLFPDFCGYVYDGGEPKGGMDWEAYLVGNGTLSVYGTSMCGTNAGTPGSSGNPGSSGGSDCWCRLTELDDGGSNHFIATSSDWFYYGDDWGNYADCTAYCPEMCAKKLFSEIPCDMAGGEFCTSGGSTPTYTVTYSCSPGSGSPTDSNSPYAAGATVTALAANSCTAPTNQILLGWNCGGTFVGASGTFTMPSSNTTCSAVYSTFSVGTVSMASGSSISFDLSAQGTFYVDCGTGGTLSGPSGSGVVGNTITKNDTTAYTYTCTYTGTTGTKTIGFAGTATAYGNSAAISFLGDTSTANAAKVASIYGDLSTIFPRLGSNTNQNPRFISTFKNTSITSIPSTLFSGYTGNLTGASYMFNGTFETCTGLTGNNAIPAGLFSGITGGAQEMFRSTFAGCTGITSIPAGLFSGITTPAEGMFYVTFSGCTGLTSIQSGLFYGITTSAVNLFAGTFSGCTGLTGANAIPADLFSRITTGAEGMFRDLFSGCTGLTTIPSGLFASITTSAQAMFRATFYGCTGLTGYIPPDLFAGLTPKQSSYPADMINYAFDGCTNLATSCPSGTAQYVTGYESGWGSNNGNNYVSCIEIPSPSFYANTTSMAVNSTFTFKLSAQGLFNVDCGAGGVLSGDSGSGVAGTIITKTDTAEHTYTCTYSSSGTKTISFAGTATAYSLANNPRIPPISFDGNTKLASVTGTLSSMFPTSAGTVRFYGTFRNCTYLTTIPSTLFSGYTGNSELFRETFEGCTRLQAIPSDLFSSVTGIAWPFMFYKTFKNCTSLTALPENLFSGITGTNVTWGDSTFEQTFYGCTGLTGYIPPSMFAGLIAAGHPYKTQMMYLTFYNTGSLATSCSGFSGKAQYITGYEQYWDSHVSCDTGYTVSYACGAHGSGTPTDSNSPYTHDRTVTTLASNACTAANGWQFSNWSCNQSVGTVNAESTFTMPSANVTCTAQWTAIDYTVSFAPGSGSGTMNGQTGKHVGDVITLPNSSFSGPNGYHFNKWNCDNGIGDKNAGATFTMPAANVTCTAQWTGNQYTVDFGCNGGTWNSIIGPNMYMTYGSSYSIPSVADRCVRAGYSVNTSTAPSGATNLSGWVCSATDIVLYLSSASGTWTSMHDYTCSAQWTANTYTLTYNMGNPGNGVRCTNATTPSTTATMGQSATIATNGFSCSGVNFVGWRCQNTNENIDVSFSSGQTVNPWIYPANLTCAAQWTQDTTQYTVSYNCGQNGSGTAPASQSFMLNQAYTLADAPGSCVGTAGYKFNGWTCTNGLSGALNANGTPASGTWSLTSNSVCHPSWAAATANTINLSWAATNSGQPGWTAPSGTPDSCSYGSTFTPVPTAPTKNGYHFTGWNVVGNWFKTHAYYIYSAYYFSKVLSSGSTICKQGTYSSGEYSTSTVNCSSNSSVFNKLSLYDWAAEKAYYYYYGTSLCSMTPIVVGQNIGTPSNTAGRFCWCKLTGYAELTGMYQSESFQAVDNMPWVHMNCFAGGVMYPGYDSTTQCQLNCASKCAEAASLSSSAYPLYNGSSNSNTTFGPCVDINVQLPEGR